MKESESYKAFLDDELDPIDEIFESERSGNDLLKDCVLVGTASEVIKANRVINLLCVLLFIESLMLLWMASK